MQEVCKCVLGIGLTSRVLDIAIQHRLAYIVDRSRKALIFFLQDGAQKQLSEMLCQGQQLNQQVQNLSAQENRIFPC